MKKIPLMLKNTNFLSKSRYVGEWLMSLSISISHPMSVRMGI